MGPSRMSLIRFSWDACIVSSSPDAAVVEPVDITEY